MRIPQNQVNQVLIPFTKIDGFEGVNMYFPRKTNNEFVGQQLIIGLNKKQTMNFYDMDGDFHQLQRHKDGLESILIYNNFLIYDAGELYITNS